MRLNFKRVNVLPAIPDVSTLYFIKVTGNDDLCKLAVVGNEPSNIRYLSAGGSSGTNENSKQSLHPELSLF